MRPAHESEASVRECSVVIAYRDMGCPHRRASYEYVHAFYEDAGFEVVVQGGDDSFTRAQGINAAVRRASYDIIIQSDPDSLASPEMLDEAIRMVEAADGLVIVHDRYLYLTPEATSQVLAGRPVSDVGPDDCESYGHGGVGNVTAFHRSTWVAAGELDERFGMWAGDDAAFAYACDAFVGPMRRVSGDMVHLWHPRLPQSVPGDPEYQAQFAILAEYRDAAAEGPEAVRALVASR